MDEEATNDTETVELIESEPSEDDGEMLSIECVEISGNKEKRRRACHHIIDVDALEEENERPIMLLLKRLIRNKQSTVMTNTQIILILKEEFDINVKTCHELEVDIYIKIIKKYLKDWPQWEELERISSKLSSAKDFDAVTKVLDHKYKNLKEYLGVMLNAAQPLARKAVADLESDGNVQTGDQSGASDVVMEVFCTRDQLNHLFFNKPRIDMNNAIFNMSKIEPTRITLNTLSFESILNFWSTKIYINLPNFVLFREVNYKYDHTLVNKIRNEKLSIEPLDTRVFNRCKKAKQVFKNIIQQNMDRILNITKDEHLKQLLRVLFHILKTDFKSLPEIINVPSSYKKYANPYKYVRYLYVENKDNSNEVNDSKYNLQLEEVVAPTYQLFIGRIGNAGNLQITNPISEWLKIECLMCKVKFQGSTELMSILQAHFNDHHQFDPDWQCSHCKRMFGMDFLSKNKWCHEC